MSFTLRIDVKGVTEALGKSDLVLKYVDGALATGALLIQREAVRAAPKAEGTLHRGIQTGRLAQLLHQINSRAAHGAFVERGTGLQGPLRRASGKPNLSAQGVTNIGLWIARKGIEPRDLGKDPAKARSRLAFLIARSIARKGTRPQPYLYPANNPANASRIADLVQQAMQRGISEAGLA